MIVSNELPADFIVSFGRIAVGLLTLRGNLGLPMPDNLRASEAVAQPVAAE